MADQIRNGYRPVDIAGVISNTLLLALAVVTIIAAGSEYDRVEEAFLHSAKLADDPNPCAIPTPDVYELHLALGHSETDIFHVLDRDQYQRHFEDALCNPPGVVSPTRTHAFARSETFAILMSNCSCLPSPTDDGLTVEMRIVTELCQLSFNGAKKTAEPTGFFNAKLYGDLVERVSRAYLAALPAFAKQQKKVDGVEEACFTDHPFRSTRSTDECPRLAVIRDELANAGSAVQSALMLGRHTSIVANPTDSPENDIAGFYKASMPRVDQMLYRLLALSVIAYRDQTENEGQCFRNGNGLTAQQLCNEVYAGSEGFVAPGDTELRLPTTTNIEPALTGAAAFASYGERVATMIPWQNRKDGTGFATYEYTSAADAFVYGGDARPQARTCHMDPLNYLDYSPPPPAPLWDSTAMNIVDVTSLTPHSPKPPPSPPPPSPPPGTDALDGEVRDLVADECAKTMRWGLWDQSRLFGLPDVVRPFVSDSRDPNGYNNRWAYDLWKKPWFDDVSTTANCRADPKFQHRAYMGFQLAMTGLWVTLAACAAGWFIGYTVPELYAQVGTKLFSVLGPAFELKENGYDLTVYRRPITQNPLMIFVSVMLLFSFIWIVFVSPNDPAFYATTSDCKMYDSSEGVFGGAYPTTARYKAVSIASYQASGWMVLVMLVWIWAYDLVMPSIASQCCPLHSKLRKEEQKNRVSNAPMRLAVAAIVAVATALSLQVINILLQADRWKQASQYQGKPLEDEFGEAQWLAHEVRMLYIVGAFGSAGSALLGEMGTFAKTSSFLHVAVFFSAIALCFGLPFLIRASLLESETRILLDEEDQSNRSDQFVLYVLSWAIGLGVPVGILIVAIFGRASRSKTPSTPETEEEQQVERGVNDQEAGQPAISNTDGGGDGDGNGDGPSLQDSGTFQGDERSPALRQLFALDLNRRVQDSVHAPLLGLGTGVQTRSQSRAHGRPPSSARRTRHQPYATSVPGLHIPV